MSALYRHQLGAVAATAVDYTVMIAFVSGLGAAAALGTAVGAASGGVVNFTLGRRWIFRRADADAGPQARRYAMVSLGSLLLNTFGVHALSGVLQYPYVAARLAVSFAVSLLWNFPMQRRFVFGGTSR
jgi:putative flippase GtrA